jgi:hypothetical protein
MRISPCPIPPDPMTAPSLLPPTRGRLRSQQALERAELQFVVRVVNDGGIGPWRAQTGRRFSAARTTFVRHGRVSRGCAAGLVVALADQPTRDACWIAVESDPAPEWSAFWLHLSHRALPPFRSEPLFLLAWSAWRLGDRRLSDAAADAVIAEDRNHRAAAMLRTMLRGGLEAGQVPSLADRPAAGAGAG